MRIKSRLLYIITVLISVAVCAISFAACGSDDENKGNYVYEGLTDVKISEKATTYDFKRDVVCKDKDGKECEFTVNSEGVLFGTAGKYTAIYTCGGEKTERAVYIYGTPTVTVDSKDIAYQSMFNGDISGNVSAADTFGEKVRVKLKGTPNYTDTGALATGEQQITVVATDGIGNVKEERITLNVLNPSDSFQLQIPTIDLAQAYYKVEIGGRKVESVYYGGTKATQAMYTVSDGYFGITPALIKELGVGLGKELVVNFDTCSVRTIFSITDDRPANYLVNGEIQGKTFYFDEKIELPQITQSTASAQNVEFKKFIETDGKKFAYDLNVYDPTTIFTGKTGYSYIVEIYKNGIKETEEKGDFTVENDCYFLQNFASDENLDKWTKNSATGTLTEIDRNSGDKVMALKYYKADADGTWDTARDNGLILKADLIAKAKAAGYTRLQFNYRTESEESPTFQVHREENGKYTGAYLVYFEQAHLAWRPASIDLSNLSSGQGLMFINLGTTLYLSNVTFKGKDYKITDFDDNFATEKYKNYIWEVNNGYATEVSLINNAEYNFTEIKVEKDENKTVINGGYASWFNYSLYLNEKFIASAIKAGKTKMTIWYRTEKYPAEVDKSGALVIYKFAKGVIGNTVYIDNYAEKKYNQATIDISGLKAGESLAFYCYGKVMSIAKMTFAENTDPYAEDIFDD